MSSESIAAAETASAGAAAALSSKRGPKSKARAKDTTNDPALAGATKRRCVSTACIACRKRKSKCDGNTPSCAACSSVYGTECIYDPNSDHRRKGVYKKDIDNLKTRNSTLQTLIQAILNYPEDEVADLVKQIRTCESLDDVAEGILAKEGAVEEREEHEHDEESPLYEIDVSLNVPTFETQLSTKMGELRMEDGSVRFIGGTSNLIFLENAQDGDEQSPSTWWNLNMETEPQHENPLLSWTEVTTDADLIIHLMTMYFTWHYTYFTTLSKSLFYRDFLIGAPPPNARRKTRYCSALLVNAILALGCHFTSRPGAREDPEDSATAGDHFFREAKRLIMVNDEHEKPNLTTVQALALMSVREAGCGREAKGWVYSGMSFRMAYDMGLNLETGGLGGSRDAGLDEQEIDARRITIWGCFLFDKCWSNYLGRQPQVQTNTITAPKFDVFPVEDSDIWSPFMDSGIGTAHAQPSRTRAVALQISALCEISSDLLTFFYHPSHLDRAVGKQAELKKLSELHTRLEAWKKNLPREMEPKEGALPNVLLMHMFFHLLFIHLFRPFLRYTSSTSPLPHHVSPRKLCTQAAGLISKLMRLYKRTYQLRQICNVAVYICHSACTIHLLNLPDKTARRDIIHGVKHLEEIAEGWLCARRTLGILTVLVDKWKITDLPEEAQIVLERTSRKFGAYNAGNHMNSSSSRRRGSANSTSTSSPQPQPQLNGLMSVQQRPQLSAQEALQQAQQLGLSNAQNQLSAQQVQQAVAQAQQQQAAARQYYQQFQPSTSSPNLAATLSYSTVSQPYALDAQAGQSGYYAPAIPSNPSTAGMPANTASFVHSPAPTSTSTTSSHTLPTHTQTTANSPPLHVPHHPPRNARRGNSNGETAASTQYKRDAASSMRGSASPSALLASMATPDMNGNGAEGTVMVLPTHEESQDWWWRDQMGLAAGFDNWVDGVRREINGNGVNGVNGVNGLGERWY